MVSETFSRVMQTSSHVWVETIVVLMFQMVCATLPTHTQLYLVLLSTKYNGQISDILLIHGFSVLNFDAKGEKHIIQYKKFLTLHRANYFLKAIIEFTEDTCTIWS